MSDHNDLSEQTRRLATRAVHAGEPEPRIEGAVAIPIFQSATFETAGEKSYDAVRYVRLNNTPNHQSLHAKLASLEAGEAAVVASSGMAAITTTLLALLSHGDHLLALEGLYGGTHTFVTRDLAEFGIAHDLMDGNRPETWSALLKPSTRAIYVETITNPLMQVPDLEQIVRFARKHGLVSIIDSTFATPVNYRPLDSGFDLVVHSGTKYLNGHSDLAAGAVIGDQELVSRVTRRLNLLGGVLDPHACFLLQRGIKTLVLRVRQQNENALALARFLAGHPAVEGVNFPRPGDPSSTRPGPEAVLRLWRDAELRGAGGCGRGGSVAEPSSNSQIGSQPGRCGDPDHPSGHHFPCRRTGQGTDSDGNLRLAGTGLGGHRGPWRSGGGFRSGSGRNFVIGAIHTPARRDSLAPMVTFAATCQ